MTDNPILRPLTYHGPGVIVEPTDYVLKVWAPTDSGFPAGHRPQTPRLDWCVAFGNQPTGLDDYSTRFPDGDEVSGWGRGETLDYAVAEMIRTLVATDWSVEADALEALEPMRDAVWNWCYPPTDVRGRPMRLRS
jgi:hypothetical protein